MQDKSYFRESILKQFISPEQLDRLIQIALRVQVVAITLCALLLLIVIWSFWGTVPTRGERPGILLAGGSDIYEVGRSI